MFVPVSQDSGLRFIWGKNKQSRYIHPLCYQGSFTFLGCLDESSIFLMYLEIPCEENKKIFEKRKKENR